MPRIYTLGAKAVLGSGYKKGLEEKKRYNEAEKDNDNQTAYNRAVNAYNSYLSSKEKRESEKWKRIKGETVTDTDSDTDGGYFKADSLSTKEAYEKPSDEANAEAYKNEIIKGKAKYKFDTSRWRKK